MGGERRGGVTGGAGEGCYSPAGGVVAQLANLASRPSGNVLCLGDPGATALGEDLGHWLRVHQRQHLGAIRQAHVPEMQKISLFFSLNWSIWHVYPMRPEQLWMMASVWSGSLAAVEANCRMSET